MSHGVKEKGKEGSNVVVLKKIDAEGEFPLLYSLVECEPQSFFVCVTEGGKAWKGSLTHASICEMARKLGMNVQQIIEETRLALTEDGAFTYTTQLVDKGKLELVWKKVEGHIKIQFGSLTMDPCQCNTVHSQMLEHSIHNMAFSQTRIQSIETDKARLAEERASLQSRLDKCVSLKEELEADLYGKFKLVLNEKKAKIRRLMESLDYMSSQSKKSIENTPSTKPTKHKGSESEDNMSGAETDNDKSVTPPPASSFHVPTTQTTSVASTLLGRSWENNSSPPVKRRKRVPRKPASPTSAIQPTTSSSHTRKSQRDRRNSDRSMESDELLKQL